MGCVSALVLGALLAATVAGAASSAPAVVKVAFNAKMKQPIVVDAHGFTLYMFGSDPRGKATCVGNQPAAGCGRVWPPLTTAGRPRGGKGIKASLLGTTTRSDGRIQVTYNGHALYYFRGYQGTPPDKRPGDVHGEGFYGLWFALTPRGTPAVFK